MEIASNTYLIIIDFLLDDDINYEIGERKRETIILTSIYEIQFKLMLSLIAQTNLIKIYWYALDWIKIQIKNETKN